MGSRLFDAYSLLHFSVGVLAYFWSISLLQIIVLHILFEYVENTTMGMYIITTYFKDWWPGGKPTPDSFVNRVSDILCTGVGWMTSFYLKKWDSS